MMGSGEIPISRMQGFRPPDDAEHEKIQAKVKKNMKRSVVSVSFYSLVSLIFIVMYMYIYFTVKTKNKVVLFTVVGIFAVAIIINIYRFVRIDKVVADIVERRDYLLCPARIHHLMPSFGTQFGNQTAKIQDMSGNVYAYEFLLNRQLKKIYKKNENAEIFIIKLDEKRELYSITYFEPQEPQEGNIEPL